MNLKARRILLTCVGVFVTGISVGIFQAVELGTDPFTSFITGLCNITKIQFGILYTIICAALLCLVFIVDKHYIGIATVFNLIGNGITADITRNFLDTIIREPGYITRIVLLSLGVILMCFAASMYFAADLGVSAYDAVSKIMTDKKIAQFRMCRIITDGTCVIIGFTLNASVGIGTVITAVFMGPLIQWISINCTEPFLYGRKIEKI